jgi:hypothetical protein
VGYVAGARAGVARLKARAEPKLAELALEIRDFVRTNTPDSRETFFDGPYAFSIIYNAGPEYTESFAYIAVYKKCVNLGFTQGTRLPDPQRLLTGTGRLMRHVRISERGDLETKGLAELVDAAATLASRSGAPLRQRAVKR